MALNSFDRRYEPEPVVVLIYDDYLDQSFARSFMASFEPLNQGVRVMFDKRGVEIAENVAKRRTQNASKLNSNGERTRKLLGGNSGMEPGQKASGDREGCFGELAVVALTGVEYWPVNLKASKLSADVGCTLQVRATRNVESWIPVYPEDEDDQPFIGVTVDPPSPVCIVHGWVYALEAKLRPLRDLRLGNRPFHPSYPPQHHDLCDLPEDNFAWLRSLPTGYLKQIQEQEQYEKEHVGEFQF